MSEEEHYGEEEHKSDIEAENVSEKQDFESPPREDEEEKASPKDDDEDFGEISYEKGNSGIQGEDDEDDEGDKRKKRGLKKMKDVRKKQKKEEGSDNEDRDFGVSDKESGDEAPKNKKGKGKRAKNEIEQGVVDSVTEEMLSEMQEAYNRDREANKGKQPALEKLKYLNTLITNLKKPQVQTKFLDEKGLDWISKWLDKMPDGSAPGQTLKKKLIEVVSTLPVSYEHVHETPLSKKLYEYYKNPKEDIDLKKTLKIIIDKFSRVALMMGVDYSNKDEEAPVRRRESALDESFRQEKIKNIFFNELKPYDRRSLNKRVGYSYSVAPQGLAEKESRPKKANNGPDYDKVYTDYKRRKNQKRD